MTVKPQKIRNNYSRPPRLTSFPHKFLSESGPHFHSLPNAPHKTIVNTYANRVIFEPQKVDFFFQRFESSHKHENLPNPALFDHLLQCLKYTQQCQMQYFLANGTGNYFQFKRVLIETYGRTLDHAREEFECAPAFGDKMPSELLADLRSILG